MPKPEICNELKSFQTPVRSAETNFGGVSVNIRTGQEIVCTHCVLHKLLIGCCAQTDMPRV